MMLVRRTAIHVERGLIRCPEGMCPVSFLTSSGSRLQAMPHVLSARAHARQLGLDPLDAAASVALADIWLTIGESPACIVIMLTGDKHDSPLICVRAA